jgi:hypothetical protein
MLQITGDIGGLIKAAQKNGSLEDLTAKLEYLNRWGESHEYHTQVRMDGVDPDRLEASLTFSDKTDNPTMYGGLIYHEHSNSWGVHT